MSIAIRDRATIIGRHIAPAAQSLQNAGALIDSAARDKKPSKAKDFARKVLHATNQIMPVVEGVAELLPVAKAVVTVFKSITKLETDRMENDDRIAVIHFSMAMSLFTLQHLSKLSFMPEDLELALGEAFGKLENIINDFGNFSSVYYAHKQSTFRVVRSGEFKERLNSFTQDFTWIRGHVLEIVHIQSAININSMNINIQGIIETLGRDGAKESAATRMVESRGGPEAVLENDQLLAEIAKKLGDKLSPTLRGAIHEDFNEMLESNKSNFDKKIHGATLQIMEAVESSKDAILRQLNEGPYEALDDEDIKAVWSESVRISFCIAIRTSGLYPFNRNGGTASNGVYLLMVIYFQASLYLRYVLRSTAIHDRFSQKFGEHLRENDDYHQDQWTLMVLSKVVFHSALGEAIDEDGSGFVSVHEVNHFLNRRPKEDFSVPEWLAFWAQGWSETNEIYRDRIQDLLAEIQADAESVLQENEEGIVNLMDFVSAFVKAIAPLQSDDESDIFDNTVSDDRYADELERLKYLYIQQEEDRLRSKLEEFDFVIDEPATLTYVIGQPRVELSIMPLVYLWLGRVHTLVNRAREENLGDDDSDALSTVATMVTILWTYNDRVTELIRVWRQQRMNVSAQIRCFCGGIFNSWYEESQNPNNIYQQLLTAINEGDDDGDYDGTDYYDNSNGDGGAEGQEKIAAKESKPDRQPKLKGDIDRKMQQLWQRMNGLDDRLGNIESLLKALVTAKNIGPLDTSTSTVQPISRQVAQNDAPVDHEPRTSSRGSNDGDKEDGDKEDGDKEDGDLDEEAVRGEYIGVGYGQENDEDEGYERQQYGYQQEPRDYDDE